MVRLRHIAGVQGDAGGQASTFVVLVPILQSRTYDPMKRLRRLPSLAPPEEGPHQSRHKSHDEGRRQKKPDAFSHVVEPEEVSSVCVREVTALESQIRFPDEPTRNRPPHAQETRRRTNSVRLGYDPRVHIKANGQHPA